MNVALLLISSLLVSGTAPAGEPDTDELTSIVRRILKQAHVRGASVALIRNGDLAWTESFGTSNAVTGAPINPNTVFEAASLGKVIAAYAGLILVDEGRWSLSMRTASPRLGLDPDCDLPTLLHLLSHTAGLANRLSADRYRGACHPPAPFAYAGQGYLVLQDLLEVEVQMSAERFIQERVFRPLGMDHSTFAEPATKNRAAGEVDLVYGFLSGRVKGRSRWIGVAALFAAVAACLTISQRIWRRKNKGSALALTVGTWLLATWVLAAVGSVTIVPVGHRAGEVSLASSLATNVGDLSRFILEVLRPALVSKATRDLLFVPTVNIDSDIAWGAGLGIDRSAEPTTYWQWGSNPGFQSLLVIEPKREDAIVVLTNRGTLIDQITGRGGYGAAKQIAREALGINGRWDLYRRAPGS